MRNIFILLFLLTIANNSFAFEPTKVAVVDMQKIFDSSTAASDLRRKAKSERDHYQALVAKEESLLGKEEAKLAEQRTLLTQDEFSKKRRQFNEKVVKVQHDFQEKRAQQEAALNKSTDQIRRVIYEIINSMATEYGFDVAISGSQVLYASRNLDITAEVLERLNKKLPTLAPDKEDGNSNAKNNADKKTKGKK